MELGDGCPLFTSTLDGTQSNFDMEPQVGTQVVSSFLPSEGVWSLFTGTQAPKIRVLFIRPVPS